jgi:hypothetical protein
LKKTVSRSLFIIALIGAVAVGFVAARILINKFIQAQTADFQTSGQQIALLSCSTFNRAAKMEALGAGGMTGEKLEREKFTNEAMNLFNNYINLLKSNDKEKNSSICEQVVSLRPDDYSIDRCKKVKTINIVINPCVLREETPPQICISITVNNEKPQTGAFPLITRDQKLILGKFQSADTGCFARCTD